MRFWIFDATEFLHSSIVFRGYIKVVSPLPGLILLIDCTVLQESNFLSFECCLGSSQSGFCSSVYVHLLWP